MSACLALVDMRVNLSLMRVAYESLTSGPPARATAEALIKRALIKLLHKTLL